MGEFPACTYGRLWLSTPYEHCLPLPETFTWADSLQCSCCYREWGGLPPFSPSTLTLPRQEWGLPANPSALNLLTLFLEVKLTRACCLPRLEKLLGLLFRMGLHLEAVGSQSKNLIDLRGEMRTTKESTGTRAGRIPELSPLPGNRNSSSKNKKEEKITFFWTPRLCPHCPHLQHIILISAIPL